MRTPVYHRPTVAHLQYPIRVDASVVGLWVTRFSIRNEVNSSILIATKLVRSLSKSPEPISKRRSRSTFGSDGYKDSESVSGPITTMRGGFTKRRDSSVDVTATSTSSIASVSSFRSLPETAVSARTVPATPIRNYSLDDKSAASPQSVVSTAYTPAWMMPLQLMDDEVQIYKQVHREE